MYCENLSTQCQDIIKRRMTMMTRVDDEDDDEDDDNDERVAHLGQCGLKQRCQDEL